MAVKSKVTWKGGYSFEADISGHKFMIDISREKGGNDLGPSPQSLLLPALASCSAVGVVGILNKMKVTGYELDMDVEAEKVEEHPQVFNKITVLYNFRGSDLQESKLKKAVSVSEERYCGVYAMLSRTAQIISIITINGEEI